MTNKGFLIIDRSILPPCYEQVIKAVKLVENEGKSVSNVCKELDISRSTYYKYKDKVFEMSMSYDRKAIISIRAEHEKGVLSNVLNSIAGYQGNILTINQEMPIHNMAYITVTLETKDLTVSVYELTAELKKVPKVREVSLLAFE
ncbi:MAG: ACT domain-containing protein [Clostridia bacterium]|jgi:chorismate mutase|nr:ACT domain-containing protein [Clostridia bacterium]